MIQMALALGFGVEDVAVVPIRGFSGRLADNKGGDGHVMPTCQGHLFVSPGVFGGTEASPRNEYVMPVVQGIALVSSGVESSVLPLASVSIMAVRFQVPTTFCACADAYENISVIRRITIDDFMA